MSGQLPGREEGSLGAGGAVGGGQVPWQQRGFDMRPHLPKVSNCTL